MREEQTTSTPSPFEVVPEQNIQVNKTGGATIQTAPLPDPYAAFLSNSAGEPVPVAGVFRLQSDNEAALYSTYGTRDPLTGVLSFRVGGYQYTSQGDFDESGALSDLRGIVLTLVSGTQGAEYSTFYSAHSERSSFSETGFGVIGTPTAETDMPLAGEAVFYGSAILGIIGSATQNFESNGTVVARADFTNSAVSVDVAVPDADANIAFDRFEVLQMTVQDTRFSGGVLSISRNGSPVAPVGTVSEAVTQGQFFGGYYNASGQVTPAEVGGGSVVRGQSGIVHVTFQGIALRE